MNSLISMHTANLLGINKHADSVGIFILRIYHWLHRLRVPIKVVEEVVSLLLYCMCKLHFFNNYDVIAVIVFPNLCLVFRTGRYINYKQSWKIFPNICN